jgi:phosphonate transport system ATP-binding protein
MSRTAIEIEGLRKTFGGRLALAGVGCTVREGEMVALLGSSGSGKSTLLRHVAGLLTADAGNGGHVSLFGREMQRNGRLSRDARALRAQVAMIFQQFNLVDRLPVMTNVMAGALHRMPAWRWGLGRFTDDERRSAADALRRVGIDHCAWQRASTLSGGQQQRAAIARALVQGARVVLADEPIASLDPASCRRVMEQLATLNREGGATVLVSLHQVRYAFAYCPRTIALRGGEVVFDGPTRQLSQARLLQLYGTHADEAGSMSFADEAGSMSFADEAGAPSFDDGDDPRLPPSPPALLRAA